MNQDNFIALKAISGKYTEKYLAKIPSFPAEVLTIQLDYSANGKVVCFIQFMGGFFLFDNFCFL
jgi:hypothetical protein